MSQNSFPGLAFEYAYEFSDSGTLLGGATAFPSDSCWTVPKKFYLRDNKIADCFGSKLSALSADWLDVAIATYLADRLSPRVGLVKSRKAPNWRRIIHLRIPVRRLETWKQPDVVQNLTELLEFFTDDLWRIDFIQRTSPGRLSERQNYLFSMAPQKPLKVALFSGGLDSFCGAAQLVADQRDHSFALVSGVTNFRQRFEQREQLKAIGRQTGGQLTHVVIPLGLKRKRSLSRGLGQEPSQRTRGFLFLTLGAVAALTGGASELSVLENGIGAINLPYDASQIGAANTRAVHPLALLRMGKFATRLLGSEFVFRSPFLFQTKGEMCRHEIVQSLRAYIPRTFSCDGFPVQVKNKPQCGSCTSCLLRRLSLQSAGLGEFDPSSQYVANLLVSDSSLTEKQLRYLRVMEWQYQKLERFLNSEAPWLRLVIEFPELQSLSSELGRQENEEEIKGSLLKLYSQYANEWRAFSARDLLAVRRAA